MALSGATLGPFLDGYHSAFGVLSYMVPKPVLLGSLQIVVTDFWVPPMFALASVILGTSYPLLDYVFKVDGRASKPSAPFILTCIAYFCARRCTSLCSIDVGCSSF